MQFKIVIADSQNMKEVADESIHLVVTSPPYFIGKEYEKELYSTYQEYLQLCFNVWKECYRVLVPGGHLCINCFDSFIRGKEHPEGYHRRPTGSYFTLYNVELGFLFMGHILWKNIKSKKSSGGCTTVMGSYPFPSRPIIKLDTEDIYIFRKPGKRQFTRENKLKSKLSLQDWILYCDNIWTFPAARQDKGHPAVFPDELPRRLIRLYSFYGDTILDPFLGSGTTMKVARQLKRNCIGYEVHYRYLELIKKKVGYGQVTFGDQDTWTLESTAQYATLTPQEAS